MSIRPKSCCFFLLSLFVLVLVPDRGGAQPLAESTFDTDASGWATDGNGTAVRHVSSGERPGGYIEAEAQNTGDIWYWTAPSTFIGDVSAAAYNGALRFELRDTTSTSLSASADVVLEGTNDVLVFTVAEFPDSTWTPYRIPLRPSAGWNLQSTGDVPSISKMKDILGNLQNVRIRGNYWEGSGATGLDNVRIQVAQTIERWVDPKQTYLYQSNSQDNPRDAIAINLSNLGLAPGDEIRITRLGEYDYDPSSAEITTNTGMLAVFSKSNVLEGSGQQDRVPGAIDFGDDVPTNGFLEGSDIAEDFPVNGQIIKIPSGATHLFLSPYDAFLGDNIDSNGNFKLRITNPDPPSGLSVNAPSGSVKLEWDSLSFDAVNKYNIYRHTASIDSTEGHRKGRRLVSDVTDTTYVDGSIRYEDGSVSIGTTYEYRLTAVDDNGNESSFSEEIRATPGPTPSPPSNVQAGADGDSSVVVQWQGVNDAEKYRVYRGTSSLSGPPDPSTAIDSTSAGNTTYQDTELIPGQTYYYRITSVDAEANESEFSEEVKVRPPLSMFAAPDTVGVAQADTVTIEVLGNDVAGEASTIDPATVEVVEGAAHGRTRVNQDGTIRYVHDGTDNFSDVFTYRVEDSEDRTDFAQVVLSIAEVTLTTERDTIDLEKGLVGALGPRARFTFTSTGDTAATGLSLAFSNSSDYAILNDTGEDKLSPGDDRTVRVEFRPDEIGTDQDTKVTLSTNTDLQESVVLTGDGVGATVEPSIDGEAAPRDQAVNVNVPIDGAFNPTSRSLYVRPGGGTYQEVSDSSKIPASLVTRKGVDYYVVLTENGTSQIAVPRGRESAARRDPFHLPVRVNNLSPPFSFSPSTYRMVSVPARTAVKEALKKSYGSYDPAAWRAIRWDPTAGENGDYREFPDVDTLGMGRGFWLITSEGETFTLGTGRTVDASTAKQIPMKPGWNQIGSPFGFSVPWDTVQTASELSGTQIDGPIAFQEGEYQPAQSVLRPWQGYFVFNATGSRDTLVVPPVGTSGENEQQADAGPAALAASGFMTSGRVSSPSPQRASSARPASSAARSETKTPRGQREAIEGDTNAESESKSQADRSPQMRADERPYTLRVAAQPKGRSAHPVWLGLRSAAEVGRDALDFAQAPPIGQTVRFSVRETIDGRSVPHSGSFKPPSKEGRAWTLMLQRSAAEKTGSTRPLRIRLQAEGALPEGQKHYLLDLEEGRRLASGQPLVVKPGEQRRLKVIVGTEAFAQKKSSGISLGNFKNELRGNAPNPFSEETRITYVLEEKSKVTLEVYNVLGQRVRVLERGRKSAGVHRLKWDGENRYGDPVGSGVYFYRIEAGDFRKTRKMVLVR